MRRLAIAIAALGLAACLDVPGNDPVPDNPSDPATETFAPTFNPPIVIASMTKTDIGDYYKDLKQGTGAELVASTTVVFSYQTYLKTGQIVDQVIGGQVDLNTVVRGLQDGMVGMREGGERIIVVPSALAFGPFNKPPIPPNSTLVFDVILTEIP
jgi:FKBP-type peptidyl-prolyl cis-trans isomerase